MPSASTTPRRKRSGRQSPSEDADSRKGGAYHGRANTETGSARAKRASRRRQLGEVGREDGGLRRTGGGRKPERAGTARGRCAAGFREALTEDREKLWAEALGMMR